LIGAQFDGAPAARKGDAVAADQIPHMTDWIFHVISRDAKFGRDFFQS